MCKRVLAAGIVRDYEFDTPFECWMFLYKLDKKRVDYQLLEKFRRKDRSVVLRIMVRYNGNPFIHLYDDQRSMFHDQQLAYCRQHYNSDGHILCANCQWPSICDYASESCAWEYCERFDALREVTGDA